jgi:hypothetical protein
MPECSGNWLRVSAEYRGPRRDKLTEEKPLVKFAGKDVPPQRTNTP